MIIGVDPGLDGAIFFLDAGAAIATPMPTVEVKRGGKNKREIDIAAAVEILNFDLTNGAVAYVEQVGAMPGQGVSSMFSFGKSYGILLGVLAALYIGFNHVSPVTWKKALNVRGGKEAALLRASELMPQHSKYWTPKKGELTKAQALGIADAALIAYYGVLHQGGRLNG